MAIESPVGRRFRVGIVVLAALVFLMLGVLMVGKRAHLFTAKLPYQTQFDSAAGLVPGNPVRLNGVTVGNVLEVNLSPDPADQRVRVIYEVDRKVAPRLRTGTLASIKTIGLLGDKYIELSGGLPEEPIVPPDGEIKAAKVAGLDEIFAGGGDLMADLGGIARSLKAILEKMERGGVGQNLNATLLSLSEVLGKINRGESLAGKLLADRRYGEETGRSLSAAVTSLRNVFGKIEKDMASGEGMIPALLSDPEGKKKVYDLVDKLGATASSLSAATASLNSGQGTLATLLHNERFSKEFTGNLQNLSRRLDSIARKLDEGQGTVGKLINDPAIFDAANDLVVGIDRSALLKWLIQNRQKSGIKKRYQEAQKEMAQSPPEPDEAPLEPPGSPAPTPTPQPRP
jgi:phospholipid/cholesterol/gamma-HCH transport system substrate-binding protein